MGCIHQLALEETKNGHQRPCTSQASSNIYLLQTDRRSLAGPGIRPLRTHRLLERWFARQSPSPSPRSRSLGPAQKRNLGTAPQARRSFAFAPLHVDLPCLVPIPREADHAPEMSAIGRKRTLGQWAPSLRAEAQRPSNFTRWGCHLIAARKPKGRACGKAREARTSGPKTTNSGCVTPD